MSAFWGISDDVNYNFMKISLGQEHIGYRRLDFPILKLSVVGGRPFSCGGGQVFRKRLLSARFVLHTVVAFLRESRVFLTSYLFLFLNVFLTHHFTMFVAICQIGMCF